jgi:hypothetical protein
MYTSLPNHRLPPLPRFGALPSFPLDESESITRPMWLRRPQKGFVPTLRLPRRWVHLPVFVYGLAAGVLVAAALRLVAAPLGHRGGTSAEAQPRVRTAGAAVVAPDALPRHSPTERANEQPPLVRAEDLPIALPRESRAALIDDEACPADGIKPGSRPRTMSGVSLTLEGETDDAFDEVAGGRRRRPVQAWRR